MRQEVAQVVSGLLGSWSGRTVSGVAVLAVPMAWSVEPNADFVMFVVAAGLGLILLKLIAHRIGAGLKALQMCAVVVTILCVGGHFAVRSAEREAKSSVRDLVSGFAPTYAFEMERMGHEHLRLDTPPDDPHYQEMIQAEIRWLAANPRLADIYTFKKTSDGGIALIVDSETDYNHDGVIEGERERRTALGERYSQDSSALERAFLGESFFQNEIVSDRWGEWVSAYVPLHDSAGNVDGVLGVDFDANAFRDTIATARRNTVGYFSFLVLLALVCAGVFQVFEGRARMHARELSLARAAARNEVALARTSRMANIGWWELDVVTGELSWSDQVRAIHEVGPDYVPVVSEAIKFYAPEVRPVMEAAVKAGIAEGRPWDLELPMITAKGRRIWVHARGEAVLGGGKVLQLCGAFQDISDRKAAEEELRITATTDRLTGLPNRSRLLDRLQLRLERARRAPGSLFAVLYLDFDRFKILNDSLGHEAGDQLLKQIAERLRAALRSSDSVARDRPPARDMPGRIGGDEFVVILDDIHKAEDAATVAAKLIGVFSEPYRIGDHEVVSTASIGVVIGDATAESGADLLRDADTAMYQAKLDGRGRFVVFDAQMRLRMQDRMLLEGDLRNAVKAGQLSVFYQPIVGLQDGRWVGAEALLRWHHPRRGPVSPAEFIPVAEETGLIIEIGEWVLRRACIDFQQWRSVLGSMAPQTISVNLSRSQLALVDLPERVRALLNETGLEPRLLRLEVTETQVMGIRTDQAAALRALKAIGVDIAMDDFGTGLSSLSGLHQLPIDVIKIDRSFVASIGRGKQFLSLATAIVDLARNLNMQTVAEGIETPEQAAALQAIECQYGQGYLFARALPAAEFEVAARHQHELQQRLAA